MLEGFGAKGLGFRAQGFRDYYRVLKGGGFKGCMYPGFLNTSYYFLMNPPSPNKPLV